VTVGDWPTGYGFTTTQPRQRSGCVSCLKSAHRGRCIHEPIAVYFSTSDQASPNVWLTMDPLTAISLASNVAQFIAFGCKLFSTTRKIHTSRTGLRSDAESIQALTLDLQGLCLKLKGSLSHKATSDDEVKLIPLGLQCQRAAEELLSSRTKNGLETRRN
jgi:hypothetical protein